MSPTQSPKAPDIECHHWISVWAWADMLQAASAAAAKVNLRFIELSLVAKVAKQ